MRFAAYEVVAPDMVAVQRPQADAGSVIEVQPGARLLLVRHLEPFGLPDPPYSPVLHCPTLFLQHPGDGAISVPTIEVRQFQDGVRQGGLVRPGNRFVALGCPWLPHHAAGNALRYLKSLS